MPYEVYKILHLSSLMLLFLSFAASIFSNENKKLYKILAGVMTLFVLVSGFGLLARLGIAHGSAWGTWVYLKMFIWAIVGIGGPIIIKRLPAQKMNFFWLSYLLFIVAAVAANYKF
jgi:uncharacterized membrane protein SirB2